MVAELVAIRGGVPPLSDIPQRLRFLAEEIEQGTYGNVPTLFVLLPIAGNYPHVFGLGDVTSEAHPIIQLELAKQWFVSTMVST